MNYKKRLTLLFVGIFFLVLASILSFIYASYAEFRRDEFFERLRQKSYATVRLLAEVKEIDRDLLKIIDRNTINKMMDEKVLVFNENNELIYSSLDDETIPYSTTLIKQIRTKNDRYYVDDDGDEVVGVHYADHGHDYVVLASAYDKYGRNKMRNLQRLVIGSLLGGTILIAFASYFYIRQVFRPIDQLNHSIKNITENNLQEFVQVRGQADELDQLAQNYNQMLRRLYGAFEAQRSFVRNASHELKTPLALMQSKLEMLQQHTDRSESQRLVYSLMESIGHQAALVESLLLMQRLQSDAPIPKTALRADEILDQSVHEVKERFPEFTVEMDMDNEITSDNQLTVMANNMLLRICFKNLVTNAAIYTPSQKLKIIFSVAGSDLQISFINPGDHALPPECFEPFYREAQQQEKQGSGLGLSIVRQILDTLSGSIEYRFDDGDHIFAVRIPHL